MQADKSTLNKNDAATLRKRLALLKLSLPAKTDSMVTVPTVSEKNFVIEINQKKIEKTSFAEKIMSLLSV